jgi:mono/diheme cytochrome c family protein
MRAKTTTLKGIALLGALLAGAGCNPRKMWPASMEQQQAVQPYDEARLRAPSAVPVGGVETVVDRDDVEDSKSPTPFDAAAVARGAVAFAAHCAPCHGPDARGDGRVSDKFPQAPNLRHYSICKRTDGFLYGTLTAGGRAMPTMREGLTSKNRWDLVAYVRSVQKGGCVGQPETGEEQTGGTSPGASGGAP